MLSSKIISSFCFVFLSVIFLAQEKQQVENDYLTNYLSNFETLDDDILADIDELRAKPLYIKDITSNDLTNIPFITSQESEILLFYIHENIVLTKFELLAINTIPYSKLLYILSFFTDSPPPTGNNYNNYFMPLKIFIRSRFISNDANFSFIDLKQYNRIKINSKLYDVVLLSEKDYGETKIADFYSFGISLKQIKGFDFISLGRYKLNFAKGLAINNSYGVFKDFSQVSAYKETSGSIYSSVDENLYLQGINFQYSFNSGIKIGGFYSTKWRDATYFQDGHYFKFRNDGFHITPLELESENSLKEQLSGFISQVSIAPEFKISILYANILYSQPIRAKNRTSLSFNLYSVGFNFNNKRYNLNGELAYFGKFPALNISAEIYPVENISFYTGYRYFHHDYFSPYNNSVSEYSDQNETGVFVGIKLSTGAGVFYLSHDKFISKSMEESPLDSRNGNELLLRYYSIKVWKLRLYFSSSISLKNESAGNFTQFNNENYKIAIQPSYLINEQLLTKLNIKYAHNNSGTKSSGWLIETVNNLSPSDKLDITIAVFIFNSKNFDSRLFNYSYNVPGTFSIMQYFGKGSGYSFLANYQPFSHLKLSLFFRRIIKFYKELKTSDSSLAFQFDLML